MTGIGSSGRGGCRGGRERKFFTHPEIVGRIRTAEKKNITLFCGKFDRVIDRDYIRLEKI